LRLDGEEFGMDSVCISGSVEARSTDGCFQVWVCTSGDNRTVHVAGELDMLSRDVMVETCLDGTQSRVVVDMSALAFMDCGGYRAIVEARLGLERRGGSLTLTDPAGEPARLLSLIGNLAVR
jgi:anti-anti-sigma factor